MAKTPKTPKTSKTSKIQVAGRLVVLAVLGVMGVLAQDKYIFSADGVTVGSSPRELPSQGFDRVTGQVVVGLHARTDAERAACGWWRIVETPKPGIVFSNEYWAVTGYTFTNSVAYQAWGKKWLKVKPVKYSRLSIYMVLKELGKWDAAEAFMRANGLYEPFMFAQEISSDHPQFVAVKAQVAEALGLTVEQVDALLKECVLK